MKLNDAVNARIKHLREERGMTQYGLFKCSGVPQSTLVTIKKKKCKSAKLVTIAEICEGLSISLKDFFDDPLFNKDTLEI